MTMEVRTPDAINAFIDVSPIADWLGASVHEDDEGRYYRLKFDDAHIGNPLIRALHGGAIAAFLEFAGQCEVIDAVPDARIRTINIDVDYLRSSHAADMMARAAIKRRGRRLAIVEIMGWQKDENQPIAHAILRLRIGENSSDD